MPEGVIYTIQKDVRNELMAVRLTEDGGRTGIYGPPGDIRGRRLLQHEEIIAALRERGYEPAEFLSKEAFDLEADKRHAKHLGISLEEWQQF